jgi:hypothetical protein
VGNGGWSDGGGVALSEMRSARCVNYAPKETPHRGNEHHVSLALSSRRSFPADGGRVVNRAPFVFPAGQSMLDLDRIRRFAINAIMPVLRERVVDVSPEIQETM